MGVIKREIHSEYPDIMVKGLLKIQKTDSYRYENFSLFHPSATARISSPH